MKIVKFPHIEDELSTNTALTYIILGKNSIRVCLFAIAPLSSFPIDQTRLNEFKEYILSDTLNTTKERWYIDLVINLESLSDVLPKNIFASYKGSTVLNYDDIPLNRQQDFAFFLSGFNYFNNCLDPFTSVMANTYKNKNTLKAVLDSYPSQALTSVVVPYVTKDLYNDDNYLIVWQTRNYYIEDLLDRNLEVIDAPKTPRIYTNPKCYFPAVKIEGSETIKKNSHATYTVDLHKRQFNLETEEFELGETVEKPIRYILDSSAGYIPVRVFDTTDGKISFDLYTDNVPVGTEIIVKVNTELYTNLGNIRVLVNE